MTVSNAYKRNLIRTKRKAQHLAWYRLKSHLLTIWLVIKRHDIPLVCRIPNEYSTCMPVTTGDEEATIVASGVIVVMVLDVLGLIDEMLG